MYTFTKLHDRHIPTVYPNPDSQIEYPLRLTLDSVHSGREHVDVPRRHVSAELDDFVFQTVDDVLEVVDVQVLRTDCELDQR